jgi:hypothetical protein
MQMRLERFLLFVLFVLVFFGVLWVWNPKPLRPMTLHRRAEKQNVHEDR